MSRNDQVKNLMSPQETKLYRRIEHLCHFAFRDPKTMDHSSPALRVFSNIPLSQLVNKWDDYARTKLLDVWQVTQKDLQPRASVRWMSHHSPLFRWDGDKAKWTYGFDKDKSVWDTRHKNNVDWWRTARGNDPGAKHFFEAIDIASSEEEFNNILKQNYLVGEMSDFEIRRNTAYMQSLDIVIADDNHWSPFASIMHNPPHSSVKPKCVIEHDGMVGSRIVDGELKWSEGAVGKTLRDKWSGRVVTDAVEHRIEKMNDKLSILKDIGVPATVTNHDSLACLSTGRGMEWMNAEISTSYLLATTRYFNTHFRDPIKATNESSRWNLLACETHMNQSYRELRLPENSNYCKIERTTAPIYNWDFSIYEDLPPGWSRSIIQNEYHQERWKRHLDDPGKFYEDMGIDPNQCNAIRIEIEHPQHGKLEEIAALDPLAFSGSTLTPEDDHVMLAGWTSAVLMEKIRQMNQGTM